MGQNPEPTGAGAQAGAGLAPNVAAAVSYVGANVTGAVFYILERTPFVRFHAWQAMLFGVAWIALWQLLGAVADVLFALSGLLGVVGILTALASLVGGLLVSVIVGLGGFVVWLLLILKAYGGAPFKLPILGDMAERYAASAEPSQKGVFAYVLGPITGVYLLMQPGHDSFVRFHAWQSIILSVGVFVLGVVFGFVSSVLSGVHVLAAFFELARVAIVTLGGMYFWLTALIKAGNGELYKVPYIGDYAEQQAAR